MRITAIVACLLLVIGAVPGTVAAGAGAAAAPATSATAGSPTGGSTAAAAQADCSFPVSATDGTGTEVTVSEAPDRVVVLAPSTAQIMWEIDAESTVVGMPVGPATSYLEGSSNRTDVLNPDFTVKQEVVVGLQPDVVLTADITPNATVRDLRSAGLTVYKSPLDKSLDSITGKVTTFGSFVGACAGAADANDEFEEALATIRATAGERSPRALYYFFEFTAGSDTFIGEAIETAGGDNVAANAGIEGYKRLNDEVVATSDPNWIVTPEGASIPDREPFTGTAAVRAGRTLVVDDNYISQAAPRVVIPMQRMARAFEGSRPSTDPDGDGVYEDVNGDGEVTPGDATVLFNGVFERDPGIVDAVVLYDVNGDGEVTPGDATVLFRESL